MSTFCLTSQNFKLLLAPHIVGLVHFTGDWYKAFDQKNQRRRLFVAIFLMQVILKMDSVI